MRQSVESSETGGSSSDYESSVRMSQASTIQVRVEVDKIYLKLNEIDKNNAQIKK